MSLHSSTLPSRCRDIVTLQRCALALALLVACTDSRASAPRMLPALSDVKRIGAVRDPFLVEQSGLTRSATSANLFWSHNDSGNSPQLFAMDSTGASLGRWQVTGATNSDWEAIAVGPCDDGACVYLADVGDNQARRASVTVWRVREPSLPTAVERANGSAVRLATDSASRIRIRYPDGAHDVEAMWVSPDTGIWLVTKRPQRNAEGHFRRALLFRVEPAAWRDTATAVAALVDSLPIVPASGDSDGWVTDASFSSDTQGDARVAVRTYQDVTVFRADPRTGRPDSVLSRCSLRALRERSGEAVAWMANGRLIFANEGRGSRIWAGRC